MSDSPEHNRDKWDICSAILKLVDVARDALELAKGNIATKQDVKNSEERIIGAVKFYATKKNKPRFGFKIGQVFSKYKHTMPLELSISNEQGISVTLTPKTDTGKPAKIDGAATFTVVSGDSTAEVKPDGLSADLISSDSPGDTTFLVEADADLGDGVENIQDTITLHVVGASAKNLGLAAGAPFDKSNRPPVNPSTPPTGRR